MKGYKDLQKKVPEFTEAVQYMAESDSLQGSLWRPLWEAVNVKLRVHGDTRMLEMTDHDRSNEESYRHRVKLPQEKAMCAAGGRNMMGGRVT